jgi:hypothetical protein
MALTWETCISLVPLSTSLSFVAHETLVAFTALLALGSRGTCEESVGKVGSHCLLGKEARRFGGEGRGP